MVAFQHPQKSPGSLPHVVSQAGSTGRLHLRLVVDNAGPGVQAPEGDHFDVGISGGDVRCRPRPGRDDRRSARSPMPASGVSAGVAANGCAGPFPVSSLPGPTVDIRPAVVLAAALILGSLLAVRLAQGTPPADGWAATVSAASEAAAPESAAGVSVEASSAPSSVSGAGAVVVVARPGDSLWTIAGVHAPGHDRRYAVDVLAEVNGGSSVSVGQRVVVPRQLLES